MRMLPGEINSVNTNLALWLTPREYLEHWTEQWAVLGSEPRVIRRNKRSLPAGEVKKCTEFVFCITAYKNTVIHLLSKHLDFSCVPLVWTDTWIHHREENTISFLSHITSSWFILSLGCRLYTSQQFLVSLSSSKSFWHLFRSDSSLIVLLLQIVSIFPVALNYPSKEFQLL